MSKNRLATAAARKRPPELAIVPVLLPDPDSNVGEAIRTAARGVVPGRKLLDELVEAAMLDGFKPGGRVTRLYFAGRSPSVVLLVGLGDRDAFAPETLRNGMGSASRSVPDGVTVRTARLILSGALAADDVVEANIRAAIEGWRLGRYKQTEYRSRANARQSVAIEIDVDSSRSAASLRKAIAAGDATADGVLLARELANAPANELHPTSLVSRARSVARDVGLKCRVLDEQGVKRERMGALMSVARGSDRPARFIVLEHSPPAAKGKRPLVLVGKAVTFDSGGISIKPAAGMEEMKGDMSGGAAVLGAMATIARLGVRARVVGLIPCAENMVSGSATRPGDVIKSRAGLTIEVTNTDAEGRLILADALDYAKRYKPRLVVDVATLTGACVVALGNRIAGVMANDESAAEAVLAAAGASGERFWRLPLSADDGETLKSETADIKNSGARAGGAVTAAWFLSRFAEGLSWAHLDIAGPAWSTRTRGYVVKGCTGVGVRTLVALAERR